MDQIGWKRACTKCLSDNIEKVGDRYWYCSDCGSIIEIVAKAGESKNLPARWEKPVSSSKGGKKKLEPLMPPSPGTLEATDSLDFPAL